MNATLRPDAPWPDPAPHDAARRGNRRRLLVFAVVFAVVMLAGQFWNLARPDVFQASTRLQISLPDAGGTADSASAGTFASRLQLVNSRPVLGRLAAELRAAGVALPADDEQAVTGLQAMLDVRSLPESQVIQVQAVGGDARELALVLNALPGVLRAELAGRQSGDADERLQRARDELARLEARALDRRQRLAQFRERAGVLAEREDNEAVAVHKGLTQALNVAVEKEASAAARLRALTEAAAEGRMSSQGRQDATLAALETRAHQVREDLREMERSFTPAFMAMDPRARALRVRLAELEAQIQAQREKGQASALQAAREDLASASAQVARLREQQAVARPALGKVSTRLSEAKVLEDDLAQVERARRDLLERVARLEANQQRRVAQVDVVEPAVVPTTAIRPDRLVDGAWVLGAGLLAAVLAMALVEAFNRPPALAQPMAGHTTLVLSPGWPGGPALTADAARTALPMATADAAPGAHAPALPPPPAVLTQAQAAALLAATQGGARLACAAGLLGLTEAEALALTQADWRADEARLQVRGAWARELPLPGWLAATMPSAAGERPLLVDAGGQGLQAVDLQAMLVSAALDAGLPQGASLTWDRLRITCIDWLLGQGLKFSELPVLVGRVEPAVLAALAGRQGEGPRRSAGDVDPLMPALRMDPSAG